MHVAVRHVTVGLVLLVLTACQRPGLRDVNGDGTVTILCFGDSITLGNARGAYPTRLETLLEGRAQVLREGVTGEATAAGRERIREVLGRTAPDYVIILEGINDGCNVPADVVVEHLRAMVQAVRARGAVPLLGTVFVSPGLIGGYWRQCADRINVAMRALDVQRIDFAAAMGNRWDELTIDGLHPNFRGSDVLAQQAKEALLASRE
jgi:lysophospholipase L1-like esterase